jgi:hypothetical protein
MNDFSPEHTRVALLAMKMKGPTVMKTTKKVLGARRWARLIGMLSLALLLLSATAPATAAAGSGRAQECGGTLEGKVVNGDLVVPTEATCVLRDTTVRGDVRLAASATLDAEGARIAGNLQLAEYASGDLEDTRVGGNVELRGTWAHLDMFNGAIGGRVRVEDAERINLLGTTVDGNVRFERSRLFVAHGARIKGQVQVADVEFAAIVESRVGGNVMIERASDEARICTSRIGGQATLQGNTGEVTVGGGNPALRCDGSTFDGNLRLLQNTGGGSVANNIVRNNLICRDNDPAPSRGGNKVGGRTDVQCSTL